jgi:hypothetical protein
VAGGFGGVEVALALLEMLNLARRVFGAHVSAMEAADLEALAQVNGWTAIRGKTNFCRRVGVLELSKGAPNVWIGGSWMAFSGRRRSGAGWGAERNDGRQARLTERSACLRNSGAGKTYGPLSH